MQDNNTDSKSPTKRKKRLKLPFDNRRRSIGEWTYDNRVGLCITLIAYLSLAIAFVGAKIFVGEKAHTQGIYIELEDLEALEQQKEQLEREVKERQNENVEWDKIQNLASNENADQGDGSQSDQGTDPSRLDKEAGAVADRMAANRRAYEDGLAEAAAILNRKGSGNDKSDRTKGDSKVKGSVTVSYSLSDPVRHSRRLIVPAYKCENGGQVVIEIIVNRSGEVIAATVKSGGDECMRQTAIGAARSSLFDINNDAPARQKGTITYIFIPQ